MKRYPAYKDSGVTWLGEIPDHWDIKPGLATYRTKQEKNVGMIESTVLSLSYGHLVVKPPEKLHGLVPESFEMYQIINPGDIVIRPTDLQNDWNSLRVGLARNRGIITSAYLALRPTGLLSSEFVYYLLHTYDLKKVFYGMGSGLRQNLDWTDLKRMPIFIPTSDEQSTIVAFLDRKLADIDLYIANKQKQIELLKEQKTTIINRAVTRGLDPNVKMKPSGIEWLGDIPENWIVIPIKRALESICDGPFGSSMKSSHYADNGVRVIRLQNIGTGEFIDDDKAFITEEYFRSLPGHDARAGDLLMAGLGDENHPVARACVVPDTVTLAMVKADCFRIRLDQSAVTHNFAALYFSSGIARREVAALIRGATRSRINLMGATRLTLLVPPLEEQEQILRHIYETTGSIRAAIKRIRAEIDLMQEYRTALIAEAVTGKIDVMPADQSAGDETMPRERG